MNSNKHGKWDYKSRLLNIKNIPSFCLYVHIDKDAEINPEFTYWVDIGEPGTVGLGSGYIVELSGCFRNIPDYLFDSDRFFNSYQRASGINDIRPPDPEQWESIPGYWDEDGQYKWDVSDDTYTPEFTWNYPPGFEPNEDTTNDNSDDSTNSSDSGSNSSGSDTSSDGSSGNSGSNGSGDGSDSGGGSVQTGLKPYRSWHPYKTVAYAINAYGSVDWDADCFSIVSGSTQCQGHPNGRSWESVRGLSAQDGAGESYGGVSDFEPINYGVRDNFGYGSCSAWLNSGSFWYLRSDEPSPFWWETSSSNSKAYTVTSSCAIAIGGGSFSYLSSSRAGNYSNSSPAGPPSYNAGTAVLSYRDCGGAYPAMIIPPKLYRPNNSGNPNPDGNNSSPSGRDGDIPFDYFDPPPRRPPVQLPTQGKVTFYLASSEWTEPLKLHETSVGEFLAFHPLDLTEVEINDERDPSLNVHPIQKLLDRIDEWLPHIGKNWGHLRHWNDVNLDRTYTQEWADAGLPGEPPLYLDEWFPNMTEIFSAHHLYSVSHRHQIVLLKLGAIPNLNGGFPGHFIVHRIVFIQIFDGVAYPGVIPTREANAMINWIENREYINRDDFGTFRYPELLQRYLRNHWWFHVGHFESIYIWVFYREFMQGVLATDKLINYADELLYNDKKTNRVYFGTCDYVVPGTSTLDLPDNATETLIATGTPFHRNTRIDSPIFDLIGYISRDVTGYVQVSNYRHDIKRLWVMVGVKSENNQYNWREAFGNVLPYKLSYHRDNTLISSPWLYISNLGWKSWLNSNLNSVEFTFLESNIELNHNAYNEDFIPRNIRLTEKNYELMTSDQRLSLGRWLLIDIINNPQFYKDFFLRYYPFETSGEYDYVDAKYGKIFVNAKKSSQLAKSTLNLPKNMQNKHTILIGIQGIISSTESSMISPRFGGNYDEEYRFGLELQDRFEEIRNESEFYGND